MNKGFVILDYYLFFSAIMSKEIGIFFLNFNAVCIHILYNTFSILHSDVPQDNNLLNQTHNVQCLLDHHSIRFLPKICNYNLQEQSHFS